VPAARLKQRTDRRQISAGVLARALRVLGLRHAPQVLQVGHQLRRHGLHRQDFIDLARGRRAERHAGLGVVVEFGLRQGQTAVFLDGCRSQGAVAARPRQNDADRVLALVLGQGHEEGVDRASANPWRSRLLQAQSSCLNGQGGVGRDDKDPVRLNLQTISGFDHRHFGRCAQQIDQHAFVVRGQMLHQHERHARIGGHVGEECSEGFKTTRRGADADDQR
jgi:hypothetical protein